MQGPVPIDVFIRQSKKRKRPPVQELEFGFGEKRTIRYVISPEDAEYRLRKCPFCGHKAVMARTARFGEPFVMCTNRSCGALQTPCDYGDEAAELWNDRCGK